MTVVAAVQPMNVGEDEVSVQLQGLVQRVTLRCLFGPRWRALSRAKSGQNEQIRT